MVKNVVKLCATEEGKRERRIVKQCSHQKVWCGKNPLEERMPITSALVIDGKLKGFPGTGSGGPGFESRKHKEEFKKAAMKQ